MSRLVDTTSKRVLLALLIATALALIAFPFVNTNPTAMLLVGDLPGFYSLGRIVLAGHGERLYDFEYQQAIQNTYWPQLNGTMFPTMYPPVVAVAMAIIAWLPPTVVRIILALTLTIILSILIRRYSKDLIVERFTLVLFSLPICISIVGPQNTILSILLIMTSRQLLLSQRDLLAGFCAGLLFYKPQVGIPFLLVTATGTGATFVVGAILAGVAEYLIGYWAYGGDWLLPWIEKIQSYSALRFSLDGYQFTPLTRGIAPFLLLGPYARLWEIGVFAVACSFFAASLFKHRTEVLKRDHILALFLVTFPVFVPQTNFYDLGIAIFILLTSINLSSRRILLETISLIVLVNLCVSIRQPSISLVPIAAVAVALFYLRNRTCSAS
jgi:hypothetical protein